MGADMSDVAKAKAELVSALLSSGITEENAIALVVRLEETVMAREFKRWEM